MLGTPRALTGRMELELLKFFWQLFNIVWST
jgi:hypothetical protein